MKPIVIHREAIEELDSAIAYYETQKVGLGLDLLTEVEQAISKIQQNSNLGTVYKISGLRRYVIQRFPFLIFMQKLTHLSRSLQLPITNVDPIIGESDR